MTKEDIGKRYLQVTCGTCGFDGMRGEDEYRAHSCRKEIEKEFKQALALATAKEAVLVEDFEALMAESDGVAGLHQNGEVATWKWLQENGWLKANYNPSPEAEKLLRIKARLEKLSLKIYHANELILLGVSDDEGNGDYTGIDEDDWEVIVALAAETEGA